MATYQFVPEHNGIEIYFDVKPSEDVLEELRSNGWRWHRVKQCWFSKKNSETEKFAKTLCNESPGSKFQDKKESHPIEIEETASFNYINSDGSIFSSVTITRKQQRYTVSSTNNQITCCDCNRWISIHAGACPFCGCPSSYIAEHYYQKYDPEVVRQREIEEAKRREAEQQRIRKEAAKQEKKKLIDTIVGYRQGSFGVRWRIEDWNKSALRSAAERAASINELNAPIRISDESYVELLSCNNNTFKKILHRATSIKAKRNELPTIHDKEWNNLLSLGEKEFNERICALIAKHKEELEEAEKFSQRRKQEEARRKETAFKDICGKYHIGTEQLAMLIEKYGTKENFLKKLQVVDAIGGDYRHKIDLLSYIESPDALKRVVSTLR